MIIGVTGQQNFGGLSKVKWVWMSMDAVLDRLPVSSGLTCLAIGSDQLFARMLLERNIPYTAVIPCRKYEDNFVGPRRIGFEFYLSKAEKVVTLGFERPSNRAYREAGFKVVNDCDVVLAIWNEFGTRREGSTGDVCDYALSKGRKIIVVNPMKESIFRLNF